MIFQFAVSWTHVPVNLGAQSLQVNLVVGSVLVDKVKVDNLVVGNLVVGNLIRSSKGNPMMGP